MKAIGYNTNKVYAEGVDKADLHRQLEKMYPFHEGKNSNPLSLEQNHLLPEPMIFAKEVVKDGFKAKVKKGKIKKRKNVSKNFWDNKKLVFLEKNAPNLSNREIAKVLGCSESLVHNKRVALGLETFSIKTPIIVMDKLGKVIKECSSVKEASDITGISGNYIHKVLNKKNRTAKGFVFKKVVEEVK